MGKIYKHILDNTHKLNFRTIGLVNITHLSKLFFFKFLFKGTHVVIILSSNWFKLFIDNFEGEKNCLFQFSSITKKKCVIIINGIINLSTL